MRHLVLHCRRADILQKSFAIFDEDKDGLITEQDLANVTNQKGFPYDTAEIHRMIVEHDSNGDGKLDFQEVRVSIWSFPCLCCHVPLSYHSVLTVLCTSFGTYMTIAGSIPVCML